MIGRQADYYSQQKSHPHPRDLPRIIHVAPYYPPHVGGLEEAVKAMAEGLAPSHRVDVLTSNYGSSSARLERHGNLTVHRLTAFEFAHTPVMPSLLWHLLNLPRHVVIHVHAAIPFCPEVVWLATRFLHRPYIVHFHLDSDRSGFWGFLLPCYKKFVLSRVLRSASRVVAVSPEQLETLTRNYGVPPHQIEIIRYGIAPEYSRGSLGSRRVPPVDRTFRWLFVGRLAAQKNVALLLEAAALMKVHAELVIVGDGEERSKLEELASQLNLCNVTFVGALHGADLLDQYRQADGFVLPSRKESTGLVLLEAMTAGLPVVATNVEGSRWTVGSDGILVEPNAPALAAALDRVTSDRSLWTKLARCSAGHVGQHSWSGSLERLRTLYQEVAVS